MPQQSICGPKYPDSKLKPGLPYSIRSFSTRARAAGVQVQTILAVTLTQARNAAVIYTNPSLDFRQRYEISTDPLAYFDESASAFDRLCRDVAASVVTAILENF